jgi:hypothetical protein
MAAAPLPESVERVALEGGTLRGYNSALTALAAGAKRGLVVAYRDFPPVRHVVTYLLCVSEGQLEG